MLVGWSDQNDYTNWSVNVSSTSGENQLGDGSELITGLNTRNQSLIWTDNAVHAMEFVGPPFIFNFRQLGSNCGIAGQHAAIELMVVYSGWVQKISLCMMVLSKLYRVQFVVMFIMILTLIKKKVYAGTNQEFREVTWLYPSKNATEVDRYVSYNPVENIGHLVQLYLQHGKIKKFQNVITTGKKLTAITIYIQANKDIYTADGQSKKPFLNHQNLIQLHHRMDQEITHVLDRIVPDFG